MNYEPPLAGHGKDPSRRQLELYFDIPIGLKVAHCLEPENCIGEIYAIFSRRLGVMDAEGNKASFMPHNLIAWSEPGQSGEIAPDGCWIECCKVANRKFRQAYYRAEKPIFRGKKGQPCKRKYIGEEGSEAHQKAKAAIERRNRLKCEKRQQRES